MIFSTVPNARSTELAQLCIERLKLCPAVTRSASQHVIASAVPDWYLSNLCTNNVLPETTLTTGSLLESEVLHLSTRSYAGRLPPDNWTQIYVTAVNKLPTGRYLRVPGTKNPFEKESMGYRDYYATLSEQSSLHTWLRNNSRLKNSLSPSDSASLQKLIEQSISEKEVNFSIGGVLSEIYNRPILDLRSACCSTDRSETIRPHVQTTLPSKSVSDVYANPELTMPIATSVHSNILPAFAILEFEDHFIILLEYSDFSLKDILDYSPALVEPFDQKNFLFFQILSAAKFLQEFKISIGEIKTTDFYIDNNTWIQLIPNFDSCFSQVFEKFDEEIAISESHRVLAEIKLSEATQAWVMGALSNYDYIMILNKAAGRVMNEPNNHPIMPWVTDFKEMSARRNLRHSKYRLNKGDAQLDFSFASTKMLKTGFESSLSLETESSLITSPHHVTHFFSDITYYVYKARVTPVEVLCKHVRPNWVPQEYPASMERLYEWTPDECIPEYFSDASVIKSCHADMDDIKLPAWSQGDPELFVKQHRAILECDEVSERLHYWIDITFGHQLTGSSAVTSKNLVLQLVDSHKHPMNHGPLQLFNVPHPPRMPATPIESIGVPEIDQLLRETTQDTGDDKNANIQNSLAGSVSVKSHKKAAKHKRNNRMDVVAPVTVIESLGLFSNRLNPAGQEKWKMGLDSTASGVNLNTTYGGSLRNVKSWSEVLLEDMKIVTFLWCHLWLSRKLCFEADQSVNHTLVMCSKVIEQRYTLLSRCFTSNYEEFMRDRTNHIKLTPAMLIQPHCHVIKFPAGMENCYKICKLSSLLQSTDFPETVTPELFQTMAKFLSLLDSTATINLMSICLPFVQTLVENEATRCLAIVKIVPVACRSLSKRSSQEAFLRLVVKCFEEESSSAELHKLYSISFAETLIRIFGLSVFAKKFLKFFVEGLAGSKEADKNKSAQKCTVNTDEQKSTPLGVETQVSLQDAVHRNETYSDTGQLLTSDSDKDTKSSSTSESADSCLETNDIMRKKETRDFTNSVLLTGPSWQCKTPSPSPSLANSETHDSISQGDMDEPRDALNPNFGTALSPQDNGLANRYSFSESMQMSYSRHRRATSRDLKLSDPSSPGIVKRNTLFSTRGQSRVSNITEETPEDLVSDMAVETCSALVFTLGPRIAGRFLVEELLTQTAIWFETSTLADDRSIGTLERILRCLSEAVLVYGEEVIDSQIFAFVFKQLDGITSQVSERSVASILAALHIMKLSVSLMTDPFLVKNLHKLNMVLVKVANIFLSPTSNLADNPDSRYVMASVWIKILTEICGRIGRDMILSSFMKTVLSFFTNLEDFLTRSAMPRQPLSYEFSPFKKGASSGESADFYTDVAIQQDSIMFGTPKNYSNLMRSSGEDYYLTPELYTYSEMTPEKEEEFSACFDLKLIMSIYAPLCKLLGNVYMEKRMNQFPSVKSLVDQQVDISSGSSSCSEPETEEDDEEVRRTEDAKDRGGERPPLRNHYQSASNFTSSLTQFEVSPERTNELTRSGSWIANREQTDMYAEWRQGGRVRSSAFIIEPTRSAAANQTSRSALFRDTLYSRSDRILDSDWRIYWNKTIREKESDPFRMMSVKLDSFEGHQGAVRGLIPVGNFESTFLSHGKDQTVRVWSIANQKLGVNGESKPITASFTYHLHKKSLNGVFYSTYLQKVVSCDGSIHIWDATTGTQSRFIDLSHASSSSKHSQSSSSAVALCEAGPRLCFAARQDASLALLDLRCPTEQCADFKIPILHSFAVRSVCASSEGVWGAAGLSNGQVVVVDFRNGMTPAAWKAHDSEVTKLKSLPFSPGAFLFSQSTADGKLYLWNFENSDEQSKIVASFNKHNDSPMTQFELFSNSQLVGCTGANKFISYEKAFTSHSSSDVRIEKLPMDLFQLSANSTITALAALPINRMMLLGTDSGAIRLIA